MADTKFYFDFHFPLKVVGYLLSLIFGTGSTSTASDSTQSGVREWYSNPRSGTDTGTECVTTTFKLPLSVSELSLEILRVPCNVEVWYQDRSNNWRPVLDESRLPMKVNIARSDVRSFFKFAQKVYPIVAKQLQFRLTRYNDIALEGSPYVVGLRNVLIRRNVYNRAQGSQYFEDEQDVLGNVVSKYIKDWDATKAIDDDPYTFWKSAPMPDPAAVCSLYLDLRDVDGGPKTIDKVYIDPVYTGQMLNLYYSSDDTINTRKLSPITIPPDEDDNTDWRLGRGRSDVAVGADDAIYRWSMAFGPQVAQAGWIGVEWTPGFDPADGPPNNPVLYSAIAPSGQWKPTLSYDVGAGEIRLEFWDGTDTRSYAAALSPAFTPGDPLRIVAGWKYDPDTVYISVVDRRGVEVAHLESNPLTLPQVWTLDGQSELRDFRGLVTALVVKLEDYAISSGSFQNSATYYCDPDPVIPDANGDVPSTTLDNAIYAVSWVTQEHGSGGAHETAFEGKEWTPVWRNYIVEKGMLFLPQATSMKYLKMEFTNLTEQPYPIYESGVEVKYKIFPVSVTQQASMGPRIYTGEGGFLGMGTFISQNGIKSINWLDAASVNDAISTLLGPNYSPVIINQSAGYVSDSLPNQGNQVTDISDQTRIEMGSAYVYRREALQPYILAQDAYTTTIKAEGLQVLNDYTDVPWQDIEAANPGAITHVKSTGALPVRGTDWWIYPGQQLKIPASVMTKLTDTSTVLERKLTIEERVRFNTTSIHRYEYKTLTRDASIAYFAGLREVIPFTSTFIAGEDKPFFDFPAYDPDQFVLTHTRAITAGPITTQKKLWPITNRLFERDIGDWIFDDHSVWTWDGTIGRWLRGTAKVTCNNLTHTALSSSNQVASADVGEGIRFDIAMRWTDLVVNANNDIAIRWGVRTYNGTTQVAEVALGEISYANWATHADSDNGDDSTGWIDDFEASWTVPSGITSFRMFLQTTNKIVSGNVWFENAKATSSDATLATAFKSLQTASTFNKVAVDFKDSGLWRGDSMWADIDEQTESIDDMKLAYYTRPIPENIPAGTWGDTLKGWGADDAEWGTPYAVVAVSIDGTLRRDGKRVLHFRRAAGVGQAGIKVKQWTHYVPQGLFRIGCVIYKPFANDNQLTLRLRRLADGVIVYEETVTAPAGRWFEYQTKFVEIPDSTDQEYNVELTLEGDDEDELYLSDLYTELALIRYFVKLGGIGAFLHEVTDLRFIQGRANVTVTVPVNEFSVTTSILSPEAWAYGWKATPQYLK